MAQKRRFFQPLSEKSSTDASLCEDVTSSCLAGVNGDAMKAELAEDHLFVADDEYDDLAANQKRACAESVEETTQRDEYLVPDASGHVGDAKCSELKEQGKAAPRHVASLQTVNSGDSGIDAAPTLSQIGLDLFRSQICAVIGDVLSEVVAYLHAKYFNAPNYLRLASNEYFNGIDATAMRHWHESSKGVSHASEEASQAVSDDARQYAGQDLERDGLEEIADPRVHGSSPEAVQLNESDRRAADFSDIVQRMQSQAQVELTDKNSRFWKRFLGTIDLEAWATRPYLGRLRYREELEIKRLIPHKIKKSSLVAARFGDTSVVRLYTKPQGRENGQGREIGRLPEDLTRILAPLMDLGLATFDAHVVMETHTRLSIGDPFYVLLRCYLTSNAFAASKATSGAGFGMTGAGGGADFGVTGVGVNRGSESPPKKRRTPKSGLGAFAEESERDTALRLKQRAIVRLFDKLRLVPATPRAQLPHTGSLLVDNSPTAHPTPEQIAADKLDLDQLTDFYTANQQSDTYDSLPDSAAPSDANFALLLRPYQRRGLAWMLAREKETDVLETLIALPGEVCASQQLRAIRAQDEMKNPLWSEFRWPEDPHAASDERMSHTNDQFYVNLYSGEFSEERPVINSSFRGGILADEMGLGKTILSLALVHSVPYDNIKFSAGRLQYADKSTLVVVPMSLLVQWRAEFDRSNCNSNHSCYVYYGELVQADLGTVLCNRTNNVPIVVLTTYGTVQNEWTRVCKLRDADGRLPSIGLYSVEFFRIVLDEAHTICNSRTRTARAVHELELRRRWALTGTPVVNRLDDLFLLVKFLRLDPWSNLSYWKMFVTVPFEQKHFQQTLDVVRSILQPVYLRRTKNMRLADGTPLVSLPEKDVVVEEVHLSPRERFLYDLYKSRAYLSFSEGLCSGEALKNYTQILTHILRLRQICCHPALVATAPSCNPTFADDLRSYTDQCSAEHFPLDTAMKQTMYGLYARVNTTDPECSICTAPIALPDLTVTECGHHFHFGCLLEHIRFQRETNGAQARCPDCRNFISLYRLFRMQSGSTSKKEVRFHTQEITTDPHGHYAFRLRHYDPDASSSKVQALMRHLHELRASAPALQVVVFSQFSAYLDLIESELKDAEPKDFLVLKFDGRLSLAEREKVLRRFEVPGQRNPLDQRLVVLLLSLKAGGVGLNLTCANRAFIMDPWWSPSVEDQAIDRVHRIGQSLNVKVVRLIVVNLIENKMLRIQDRKRMMGEVVGVEEEERRKQRIEEIKLLFDE